MLRLLLILGLLLAMVLGMFAWSGSGHASRADFTYISRGDIRTLDPNRMAWLEDIRVGYALWEGLYTLDPQTLAPIPGVAESVELSQDKRTYTFHIRPEACWSNGDRVTSGDFVFAWRRMLDEPANYTYLFRVIQGVNGYLTDRAAKRPDDFERVGIKALDDTTLRVELEHPVAYFLDLCAFAPFWPMHEPSMRPFHDASSGSYQGGFTRPPNLVSNGPFRLTTWDFRRNLRLERSPFYWDREHVKLRTIDVLMADDPTWAFLKYETGTADWLADGTGSVGPELYERKRTDLHFVTGFGTYFYSVNCQPRLPDGSVNPLADRRVRLALSMAIDRSPIVQTITRLGEPIAFAYIPPGVFEGYRAPDGPGYDVRRARELLAEAGYPGGKGFPKLSILFNSESHHADVAQVVRRQWIDNLGVDMALEGVEVKVFRQRLHGKDYAIARASWFGDYNDPSTFTDKYRSNSENNDSGWRNPRYDRLLDDAAVETDQARRMELFSQAEGLLLGEQPIIPLYYYVNASLFRDNVKGITMNARNMVMLKNVWVERQR